MVLFVEFMSVNVLLYHKVALNILRMTDPYGIVIKLFLFRLFCSNNQLIVKQIVQVNNNLVTG